MKSQNVILLLGGNAQNTFQIFEKAFISIQKEIGPILKFSSLYNTAAWGPIPQPDFLNITSIVRTRLPPIFLLKKILSIESKLGRKRTVKYGPRVIDIDILFYGNKIIHHKDLIIPHPQIQKRKFVLLPCNEIIPGYIHPQLKLTINELLKACEDPLEVKKWIK